MFSFRNAFNLNSHSLTKNRAKNRDPGLRVAIGLDTWRVISRGCLPSHVILIRGQEQCSDRHGIFTYGGQTQRRPRGKDFHKILWKRVGYRLSQRLSNERQPAAQYEEGRVQQMDRV